MDTKVILDGLGKAGSFFKVINKNDWAEDTVLAAGVVTAVTDLWNATGGHITIDTLRNAALWTAAGLLGKAVISLLTALHVLKADAQVVVATPAVDASKPPVI